MPFAISNEKLGIFFLTFSKPEMVEMLAFPCGTRMRLFFRFTLLANICVSVLLSEVQQFLIIYSVQRVYSIHPIRDVAFKMESRKK